MNLKANMTPNTLRKLTHSQRYIIKISCKPSAPKEKRPFQISRGIFFFFSALCRTANFSELWA